MTLSTLLHTYDYGQDFILYLAAFDFTINMVLAQKNDLHEEHVIYYLIKGLTNAKLYYTYI